MAISKTIEKMDSMITNMLEIAVKEATEVIVERAKKDLEIEVKKVLANKTIEISKFMEVQRYGEELRITLHVPDSFKFDQVDKQED